jgi:uncharacterized membrane protein YidH (DUF202 family)
MNGLHSADVDRSEVVEQGDRRALSVFASVLGTVMLVWSIVVLALAVPRWTSCQSTEFAQSGHCVLMHRYSVAGGLVLVGAAAIFLVSAYLEG